MGIDPTIRALGMYAAKPGELVAPTVVLTAAFLKLVVLAKAMKSSPTLTAILMLTGVAVAIGPDLWGVAHADLEGWGDLRREWSGTNHGDGFFAIVTYMYVGPGTLRCLAGTLIPYSLLVVHAVATGRLPVFRSHARLNDDSARV